MAETALLTGGSSELGDETARQVERMMGLVASTRCGDLRHHGRLVATLSPKCCRRLRTRLLGLRHDVCGCA